MSNTAWDCRDQQDQAETYYNAPLRAQNRRLQDENLNLKRLLRENGIAWPSQIRSAAPKPSCRVTRSSSISHRPSLPHLPVEIQLRILKYALTSPHPIVDPLCQLKPDRLLPQEKDGTNGIAIHFLSTCHAYYVEGTKILWSNNTFLFTSAEAVKNFAEVPLCYRSNMSDITFRIIAKYYDDEMRGHRLPSNHHPDLKKPVRLNINYRPKEPTLARRGFRVYAWHQLIDFLEAMLPPFDPKARMTKGPDGFGGPAQRPRPRLFPGLERLRIDFLNFGEDMLQFPPHALHDLASHHLGCSLNEVILTGLPSDDAGFRVSTELSGLVRDEGLLIDHAPLMIAQRKGVRVLPCDVNECSYSSKVVRAMRNIIGHQFHHDDHPRDSEEDFPSAPKETGTPPPSPFHSCRTIWKKLPIHLDRIDERKWVLFDRVSGLPWEDVKSDVTMFDEYLDEEDENGEGMVCDNCGEVHPGAILPDDMMDMSIYDDL